MTMLGMYMKKYEKTISLFIFKLGWTIFVEVFLQLLIGNYYRLLDPYVTDCESKCYVCTICLKQCITGYCRAFNGAQRQDEVSNGWQSMMLAICINVGLASI